MIIFLGLVVSVNAVDCEDGKYEYASSGLCLDCPDFCVTCYYKSSDQYPGCYECSDSNEYPDSEGFCMPSCNITNCTVCNDPCQTCIENPDKCTSCKTGNLHQHTCVDPCPEGYFPDNGECLKCHEYCKTCTEGTAGDCLECTEGTFKVVGICVPEICGDGIKVGTEECDDGNDLQGDGCFKCKVEVEECSAPELIRAYYRNEFTEVVVEFDKELQQAETCSAFSDLSVLGLGAECYVSSNHFIIKLGFNPVLTYKDQLSIPKNNIFGVGCGESIPYSFSVPGKDEEFKLVLSGTPFVSKCQQQAHLSTELSSTRGRKITQVNWLVESVTPLYSEEFNLKSSLSQTLNFNSNNYSTHIPVSELILGRNYLIKAEAFNFLGQSAVDYFNISSSEFSAPRALDSGPRNIEYFPEFDLLIRANAESCEPNLELEFEWELLDSSADFSIDKNQERLLVVPAYSFGPGDWATFRVHMWHSVNETSSSFVDYTVNYKESQLLSRINPRCVTTKPESAVTFDSYFSQDLGMPLRNLNYSWSLSNQTGNLFQSQEEVFSVSGLSEGLYNVTLKVSFGQKTSEDRTLLNVASTQGNLQLNYHPTQMNTLKLFSTYTQNNWSSNLEPLSPLDQAQVRFKFRKGPEAYVQFQTNDLECTENFNLVAAPSGGSFSVDKNSGESFVTEFKFSAPDWHNAFYYQYFFEEVTETNHTMLIPLSTRQLVPEFSTKLPYISQDLTVYLRVFSISNAYTQTKLSLKLSFPSFNTNSTYGNSKLNTYQNSVTSKDPELSLQNSLILSYLLEGQHLHSVEDQSCPCLHGTCSEESCVCDPGYFGRGCSYRQDEETTDTQIVEELVSLVLSSFLKLPQIEEIQAIAAVTLAKLARNTEVFSWDQAKVALELLSKFPNNLNSALQELTTAMGFKCICGVLEVGNKQGTPEKGYSKLIITLIERFSESAVKDMTLYEEPYSIVTTNIIGHFEKVRGFKGNYPPSSLHYKSNLVYSNSSLEFSSSEAVFSYIQLNKNPLSWVTETEVNSSLVLIDIKSQETFEPLVVDIDANITIPFVSTQEEFTCTFWKENNWSSEGCELVDWKLTNDSLKNSYGVCHCTHLSAFALSKKLLKQVQVQPSVEEPSEDSVNIVPILLVAGLLLKSLVWGVWGWKQDKKSLRVRANRIDSCNNEEAEFQPKPSSKLVLLTAVFKNCHPFLGVFYRFDKLLSRPFRVWVFTAKNFALIAVLAILEVDHSELADLLVFSGVSSLAACVVGSFFTKTCTLFPSGQDNHSESSVEGSFKKQSKISVVTDKGNQNQSDTQNLQVTPWNLSEDPRVPPIQYFKRFLGMLLGAGVIVLGSGAGILQPFNWYWIFGLGVVGELAVFQTLLVLLQFVLIKKTNLNKQVFSRSLQEVLFNQAVK